MVVASNRLLSLLPWFTFPLLQRLCRPPLAGAVSPPVNQCPNNHGATRGKTIEMKRGDWICSRCNFMNFAKNMKCLECNEAKPNRQLTGREWECPQCDGKRPAEVSIDTNENNLKRVENPQTSGTAMDNKTSVKSTPSMMPDKPPNKLFDMRSGKLNTDKFRKKWTSSINGPPTSGNSAFRFSNPSTDKLDSGCSGNFDETELHHPSSELNIIQRWTGKSLEGSAVKEPNPLDMSEEAKAERWFKRVAQVEDISELSQIPDEDFPSIMPMHKGVNRKTMVAEKSEIVVVLLLWKLQIIGFLLLIILQPVHLVFGCLS
ncbi:hypothetical protein ACLB2K_012759 [Fragaria x ananassa]